MPMPTVSAPIPPRPIAEIAARLDLQPADVEPYGWFAGKLALDLQSRLAARPVGKYVGVTAIHPTPLGEGKTVVAIGLAMALCQRDRRAVVTIRQPSQAPVFGIKGGGAGGGRAHLLPADDINLHFTGDLHAVAAANNLLAAMLDNHLRRERTPPIAPPSVLWKRVLDLNDKGLAHIIAGIDHPLQAPTRETGFELTAASEVMAILALARDLADLRSRLGRIVVGQTPEGDVVRAEELGCAGAMAALLRHAIRPNLVQTCEHTPALVHAGPFANIAHGNSSVAADLAALRLAEYVVTESGFGSDCGAEKFFDIKCAGSGLVPDAEVIVCTVRALKLQSGRFSVRPGQPLPPELLCEDLPSLEQGLVNLHGHIDVVRKFGVPLVVAINRFPGDTPREIERVERFVRAQSETAVVCDAFGQGGAGALSLAEAVEEACRKPSRFRPLYAAELSLENKIATVAREIYGADGLDLDPVAHERLAKFTELGFSTLPVCIAKTQYSFSHDPSLLGRPRGFRLPIRDVRLSAGAGFVYALAGDIQTMPGLPRNPASLRIDIDSGGRIHGMQ